MALLHVVPMQISYFNFAHVIISRLTSSHVNIDIFEGEQRGAFPLLNLLAPPKIFNDAVTR